MKKQYDRFVPVKQLQAITKRVNEIGDTNMSGFMNHCRICGDTTPKHGFYPLWGMASPSNQTSGLTCNRCARTDEEYQKVFGEPKEQFEEITEVIPSYQELAEAFRRTHKAFLKYVQGRYETGDITMAMGNETLLNQLDEQL